MGEFDIYNDMLLDAYLSQLDEDQADLDDYADEIRDSKRDDELFLKCADYENFD